MTHSDNIGMCTEGLYYETHVPYHDDKGLCAKDRVCMRLVSNGLLYNVHTA